MPATYQLQVTLRFAAAHKLRDYEGKCARVHGHNYRVQAEITGNTLDKAGLSMDYFDIKQHLKTHVDKLDHFYINDIPPFDTLNPTAENLAAWFYQQMQTSLTNAPVQLTAISLWESEDFCVRYSEPTP
jgi:6-pyruvoyltetrahydropterin/6-carboxytetrahydropterin synthase